MSKKVFFIIGMHRSGTSALTSMFAKGGMDLGKSLMLPGPDNPRGFFENPKIVKFNDTLLSKMNATWDVPFNVNIDQTILSNLQASYDILEKLILEDFGDDDIVIKDPRLSKLLPFYIPYFEKKGFEMQTIVCLRNPIEIIDSLGRAHGIPFEHGAWMWMSYMFDAEFHSRGIKRKFVHYEELINNPKAVFRRLKKFMNINIDYSNDIAINPILRHFRFEQDTENERPALGLELLDIYDGLSSLAKTDNNKRRTEFEEQAYPWSSIVRSVFSPKTIPYYKAAELNKYSKIQVNAGRGINIWDTRMAVVQNQLAYYNCRFDLKSFGEIQEILWFPIANNLCKIRFAKIILENFDGSIRELDVTMDESSNNVQDGYLFFDEKNNSYSFAVNSAYQAVSFEAQVELLESEAKGPIWTEQKENFERQLADGSAQNQTLTDTIAKIEEELALAKKEVIHVGNWRREKNEMNGRLERHKELETQKNDQLRVIVTERDRLKELLDEVRLSAERTVSEERAILNQDYVSQHEGLLQYRDELIEHEISIKKELDDVKTAHQSLQNKLEHSKSQNNEFQVLNNDLNQKISDLSAENSEVRADFEAKKVQESALVERIEVLEELRAEVQEEKAEMQTRIKTYEKRNKKFNKLKSNWKKRKNKYKGKLLQLEDENSLLVESLEASEAKVAKRKEKIEKLEIKMLTASNLVTELERNHDLLTQQLENDNGAWKDTLTELEILHSKHRDVLEQVEHSKDQNDSLKTKLEEADQRIKESDQKLKEADQRIKESDQKFNETDQKLEEANQKLKEAHQRIKESDQKFNETDQKLSEVNQKLEEADQKLERMKLEEIQLAEHFDHEREVFESELENTHLELNALEEALVIQLNELRDAKNKIDKQKINYKTLYSEFDELFQRSQIIQSLTAIDGDDDDYAWESVWMELKEKNESLEMLNEVVIELESNLMSERDKNKDVETEIGMVEEQRRQLEDKIQNIESYVENQRAEFEEQSRRIEDLNNRISWYQNDQNEKETKIANLEDESSDAEDRIRALEVESRNNQISLDAKRALVEDLKSDLLKKQEDLYKTSRERMRFENELKAVLFHITGLKNSLSYRLGFGLTSPLRFIYNQVSNKPFRKSLIGKPLVAEPQEFEALNFGSEDAQVIDETTILPPHVPDLTLSSFEYNVEDVMLDKNPEHPPMHIDKSKMGSVLFISPHLPDYDESSGGKRATRMLELLHDDFNVFVFTLGDKPRKYIDKLRSLGVNVLETSRYDKATALMPKIDCIIYAWYYTYFDAQEFRDIYPEAKIILDSVDVHWVRESRSIGLLEGLTLEIAAKNKERELLAYRGAAIIWVVTEEDRLEVLKEIPNGDIRVVSNIHDAVEATYQQSNEKNILFLGGYRHYPNISAAITLAKEVLPMVRAQIPDAKLILAGSHAPPEIMELGHLDGVDFEGFIEDEELNDLYRRSFLIATPLKAGAGIKGKICEAIVHRVPVVTNDIGNEGINLVTGEDGFLAQDSQEMARHIVDVMNGKYDLDEITSKAMVKLLRIVGPDEARRNMMNSIFPEISICVVTWNRKELLEKCVDSVLMETTYPRYRLIVHSNGCEDGTREYLTAVSKLDSRVEPILSDTNDVFVIPNNNMMDMYKDNDAILLNNDTVVTKNWLSALHQIAYSDPKIGISGSKLLYPDGTLQEFGSELYANGSGRNIGKWEDPTKPEYNEVREVGYVSGCSLYLKRSTLDKVGYFDEQFHPCYCEDSDLCYSAKERGLITVVTHKSVVYHFEGGTSGTDTSSGFKSYQKINMIKFMDKHRGKPNGINWEIENS